MSQGCCLTNISGAQKGKSQKVRSPTGNVLGAAAKNLGTQRTFLGAPGCWAPVRQQPCVSRAHIRVFMTTTTVNTSNGSGFFFMFYDNIYTDT